MRCLVIATALLAALTVSSCGYRSLESNELGQAKTVIKTNNLVCPDYYVLHVSLGVMKNGTGSMSNQDTDYSVDPTRVDIEKLRLAVRNGSLIETKFNTRRGFSAFCTEFKELLSFTVTE